MNNLEYAGFWVRAGATIIDTLLMSIVIIPMMTMIYGPEYWMSDAAVLGFWDLLFNHVFPAVFIVVFWSYKSATPGKIVFKLKIVDAETGGKPSTGKLIGRYLAYFVSIIPLLLGVFWVGIDKKKQGWHDKLAGTAVVKNVFKEEALKLESQA